MTTRTIFQFFIEDLIRDPEKKVDAFSSSESITDTHKSITSGTE